MKIYTSYFENIAMLKENNILPVGICLYVPKDFIGINILEVAPTQEILLKYRGYPELYTKFYTKDILKNLDSYLFINNLLNISNENNGKSIALCCYEKPSEFCHRHILADYLNKQLNLNIHEFSAKDILYSNELF